MPLTSSWNTDGRRRPYADSVGSNRHAGRNAGPDVAHAPLVAGTAVAARCGTGSRVGLDAAGNAFAAVARHASADGGIGSGRSNRLHDPPASAGRERVGGASFSPGAPCPPGGRAPLRERRSSWRPGPPRARGDSFASAAAAAAADRLAVKTGGGAARQARLHATGAAVRYAGTLGGPDGRLAGIVGDGACRVCTIGDGPSADLRRQRLVGRCC